MSLSPSLGPGPYSALSLMAAAGRHRPHFEAAASAVPLLPTTSLTASKPPVHLPVSMGHPLFPPHGLGPLVSLPGLRSPLFPPVLQPSFQQLLAGLSAGCLSDLNAVRQARAAGSRRFDPTIDAAERERWLQRWESAVHRCLEWHGDALR